MTATSHGSDYSNEYIQDILESVHTIAVVGASADPNKASYAVLQGLTSAGYEMIPVNPRPDLTEIRDLKVYPSLEAIERPVDMVEVFRPSSELAGIARQAVGIGARVLWAQLGVQDEKAARIAEAGGLKVVMNRCPAIELAGQYLETRSNGGLEA